VGALAAQGETPNLCLLSLHVWFKPTLMLWTMPHVEARLVPHTACACSLEAELLNLSFLVARTQSSYHPFLPKYATNLLDGGDVSLGLVLPFRV
jgi:hypothetical protein